MILTRILSLDQAQRELTRLTTISLRLDVHEALHIDALARVLKHTPGSCPVFLDVRDPNGKWARFKLAEAFRINPLTIGTAELEEMLGPGCVKFSAWSTATAIELSVCCRSPPRLLRGFTVSFSYPEGVTLPSPLACGV